MRVRDVMSGLIILVTCLILSAPIAVAQQLFGGGRTESCGERMRMRRVCRVTKTSRQPLIEIELYSDRVFPTLNAAVVLLLGEHVFHGGGYGDTKGHILIFTLTPEEFAKAKSGDEVIVTYQGADPDKVTEEDSGGCKQTRRVWRFGRLDKRKQIAVPAKGKCAG